MGAFFIGVPWTGPGLSLLMVKRFGLGKKERLKSRKQIDTLFLQGQRFAQFPLRVTYQFLPSAEPGIQVGVTASKKHFKRAVDRNRLKRLMREAYRLQKNELIEKMVSGGLKGFVFFMYTDRTIASFDTIRQAMSQALIKLLKAARPVHENPS